MEDPRIEQARAGPARGRRTEQVLVIGGLGVLLWLLGDVLLLAFAGILLAIALDALAQLGARWLHLSRGWALILVLLLGALSGAFAVTTLLPSMSSQFQELRTQLPVVLDETSAFLAEHLGITVPIGGGASQDGLVSTLASRIASASMTGLTIAVTAVVILAVGLFLAANPGLYQRGVLALLPPHRRPRTAELLAALGHTLRWWFIGQACSMAILGTVTSVVLWLLGVPLWLALGMFTAVLTFVPYFGPLIAGVPVLLLSFSQGLETGLTVLVIYVVLQNLEGFFITPAIQQRAIRLPPAVLITTQVAMGVLFGPPGLLLAAPTTAAAMVVVKLLYIEDVLGEPRAQSEQPRADVGRAPTSVTPQGAAPSPAGA